MDEIVLLPQYKQFNIIQMLSLKPKQLFKNYREMQEYLEAPFLLRDSRNAQISEWRRYVKFTVRRNNSIEIVKVYEEPLKKVDGRFNGNNKVYVGLVGLIIMDYLQENMDAELKYLCISKSKLYEILGFCNEMYSTEFLRRYKRDALHIEKITTFKMENNLTSFDMYTFYERSISKFNAILSSALSSLEQKSVVIARDSFMVTDIPYTEFNEEYKKTVLEKMRHTELNESQIYKLLNKFEGTDTRLATVEEEAMIVKLTRSTMEDLGLDSLYVAYKPTNVNVFSKELSIKFLEEENWGICYRTKRFSFTEQTLQWGVKSVEKDIERVKSKRRELNELTVEALIKRSEVVYNKQNDLDSMLDKLLNNDKVFTYKDNYLEAQKIIIDYFMDIEVDEKK